MIATQEITTILIFIPVYQLAAGQRTFLYREQFNSGTHCHVRSLRQTTCVLSKRNFENSLLNHFWSARRVTNWCFYLSLKSIILTFRYFIQYCKLPYDLSICLRTLGLKNPYQGRFNKVLLLLYFTNQSFLKQFNVLCQTDISAAFQCEESRQCEDEAAPAPEWNVFDMPECLTNEYKLKN